MYIIYILYIIYIKYTKYILFAKMDYDNNILIIIVAFLLKLYMYI